MDDTKTSRSYTSYTKTKMEMSDVCCFLLCNSDRIINIKRQNDHELVTQNIHAYRLVKTRLPVGPV